MCAQPNKPMGLATILKRKKLAKMIENTDQRNSKESGGCAKHCLVWLCFFSHNTDEMLRFCCSPMCLHQSNKVLWGWGGGLNHLICSARKRVGLWHASCLALLLFCKWENGPVDCMCLVFVDVLEIAARTRCCWQP